MSKLPPVTKIKNLELSIPYFLGTSSGYNLSSLIGNPVARLSRTSASLGGPIKSDHLIHILDYLFPDAAEKPKHPYPEDLTKTNLNSRIPIKTCPIDGLVWRLVNDFQIMLILL